MPIEELPQETTLLCSVNPKLMPNPAAIDFNLCLVLISTGLFWEMGVEQISCELLRSLPLPIPPHAKVFPEASSATRWSLPHAISTIW